MMIIYLKEENFLKAYVKRKGVEILMNFGKNYLK